VAQIDPRDRSDREN